LGGMKRGTGVRASIFWLGEVRLGAKEEERGGGIFYGGTITLTLKGRQKKAFYPPVKGIAPPLGITTLG